MSFIHLKQAVRVVQRGGLIAYPTEAVYGLGCDPLNAGAVLRLLQVKHRRPEKGLILMAASFYQLLPFVKEVDEEIMQRVRATWPGPTTWLLPARRGTPRWLTGRHETLAVRVTDHPLCAALCECYGGALVSTSANVAGRPPGRTALAVRRCFGGRLDYVLAGSVGDAKGPSEIRDARSDRIVRARSSPQPVDHQ